MVHDTLTDGETALSPPGDMDALANVLELAADPTFAARRRRPVASSCATTTKTSCAAVGWRLLG
jgi:hypothetical protein